MAHVLPNSDPKPRATPASNSSEFLQGAKATVPMIIGAIPFGIIFGTLAESSGLSLFSLFSCRISQRPFSRL